MSLSQSAASNLVPLLARVVLAIAFIPVGWNKLMRDAEFSGDAAKRLRELQVVEATPPASSEMLVGLVQESPTPPPSTPPASDAAKPKPTTDETAKPAGAAPDATGTPVKAKQLHSVTLLVDKMGWKYPVAMAWLAGITELVGGILVLVGLFTRLWALGLAATMAVAFYLTSLDGFLETRVFAMAIPDYTRCMAQLGLFALAFGLVLTGAGALSLDRMMFRGNSESTPKKREAS